MPKKDIGYVYLVLAPSSGLYKIGFSTAPAKRLAAICAEELDKCVLVHVIKTNDAPQLEGEMHTTFAAKGVGGEWFRLAPEDVAQFAAQDERMYAVGKPIRQITTRRLVSLPEPLAEALQEIADEQFNTVAQQLKYAVIEYLKRHDRFPG